MAVSTPVARDEITRAWGWLVEKGYAVPAGSGHYDLTDVGRDWMLAAVWTRLGIPGLPIEWYEED